MGTVLMVLVICGIFIFVGQATFDPWHRPKKK